MNIRKDKLDLYKAIILHLYLMENKGLTEIAEHLHFSDYHIVKDELKEIELRILALG